MMVFKHSVEGAKNLLYRQTIPRLLKPKLLVFEVTDKCNSKCVHCNIWKKQPTPNILSPSEIREMLSNKLFSQLRQIILTGGEVSLRTDMKQLLHAIHEARPQILVWYSTNGLLPEKIWGDIEYALQSGMHIGVGVSVDGIREKHDAVRGIHGSFERADKLLKMLLKERSKREKGKLEVSIGFTLSEKTVDSYSDVRAYAKKVGIPLIVQMFDEASFYDNLKSKPRIESDAEIMSVVQGLPSSLLKQKWLNLLQGKSPDFPCFALCTFFFLHCNGDVSPCLRRFHEVYGNVREQKVNQIWKSEIMQKGRQTVKACSPQCLNDWGFNVSLGSSYFPNLKFALKQRGK